MSAKDRTVYACQTCGHQSSKWLGKCPDCGAWNSYAEERARPVSKEAGRGSVRTRVAQSVAFEDIETQADLRDKTGITEFDRVLGGGIVNGSLVLVGGDPGIGKSTLMAQVSASLS